MKTFLVPMLTMARLVEKSDDGVVVEKDWCVRKDIYFDSEELLMDPIRLHNLKIGKPTTRAQQLAAEGFCVFHRNDYILIVNYKDVMVM